MKRPFERLVWTLTLLLVAIGLASAARRSYLLLASTQHAPAPAAFDSGFAAHRSLTFLHILPGALPMVLMPSQFVRRIRARYIAWRRWSGRLLIVVGFVVGRWRRERDRSH